MPQRPETREAIKRLIRKNGPLTYIEIAKKLGKKPKTVASCINAARTGTKKHFYVVRYEPKRGVSGLPAAVYGNGGGEDARFPETDKAATARRFNDRHRERIARVRKAHRVNPFKVLMAQVMR